MQFTPLSLTLYTSAVIAVTVYGVSLYRMHHSMLLELTHQGGSLGSVVSPAARMIQSFTTGADDDSNGDESINNNNDDDDDDNNNDDDETVDEKVRDATEVRKNYRENEEFELSITDRYPPGVTPRLQMISAARNSSIDVVRDRLYRCESNKKDKKDRNGSLKVYDLVQAPDFIIIGTQKGGTTALASILSQHPLIYSSRTFEPHFFDKDKYFKRGMRQLSMKGEIGKTNEGLLCYVRAKYIEKHFNLPVLYKHPEIVSFEKTPAYILATEMIPYMKKVVPWAKIVVTLRNPVDRQMRMIVHRKSRTENKPSLVLEEMLANELFLLREKGIPVADGEPFAQVSEIKELRRYMWKEKSLMYRGFYSLQLREWLKYYTLGENILVVRFERFQNDKQGVLDEICNFLGVPIHNFHNDTLDEHYVPLGMSMNATEEIASTETEAYMRRVFKPYNDELADMLGEEWRDVWF